MSVPLAAKPKITDDRRAQASDGQHRSGLGIAFFLRGLTILRALRRVPMTTKVLSLKKLAATMLEHGGLNETEREFLSDWADHPAGEGTWRTIQTAVHRRRGVGVSGGQQSDREAAWAYIDRPIIGQILLVKWLADAADLKWGQRGRYQEYANMAEGLISLLKNPLPMLPPSSPTGIPLRFASDDFLQQLEKLARRLQWLAEPQNAPDPMKVSPMDLNGSRARVAFMSQMGADLLGLCGLRLDEQVRLLTEIAFPGQNITIAMVRSARTTRKGRRPHSQ